MNEYSVILSYDADKLGRKSDEDALIVRSFLEIRKKKQEKKVPRRIKRITLNHLFS